MHYAKYAAPWFYRSAWAVARRSPHSRGKRYTTPACRSAAISLAE